LISTSSPGAAGRPGLLIIHDLEGLDQVDEIDLDQAQAARVLTGSLDVLKL
jgi:hypothetical protein